MSADTIHPEHGAEDRPKCAQQLSFWTPSEQAALFGKFKKFELKWDRIASEIPSRTQNSIKSFFYSCVRKIKRLRFLKMLRAMVCHPVFRNNSNLSFGFPGSTNPQSSAASTCSSASSARTRRSRPSEPDSPSLSESSATKTASCS